MKIVVFGESDIGQGLKKYFSEVSIIPKEICDIRHVNQILMVLNRYSPDVIINCAGVSNIQPIKNSSIEKWREEMEVNLFGSYLIAQASINFNPKIKMIFLASVAGLYGKPNHSGYSSSKSALITLVQSLGMEGYDAFSISPGRVDTKMREKDFPGEDKRTRLSVDQVAKVIKKCISGKFEPGDNIIIRKKGFETFLRIDSGQPWREYLNLQKNSLT
jgi:NAD(P)-dependent dehydrogenase (short-subunit alcohol dehydrogenase family)